jgi:hypothetical protein
MSESPVSYDTPTLSQHTDEMLASLRRLTDEDIQALPREPTL